MASRLERQAAMYSRRPAAKSAATPAPAARPPAPMSQTDRQALTYKTAKSKVEPGAFQKLKQETGLNDDQARKVVDWLLADEPRK